MADLAEALKAPSDPEPVLATEPTPRDKTITALAEGLDPDLVRDMRDSLLVVQGQMVNFDFGSARHNVTQILSVWTDAAEAGK